MEIAFGIIFFGLIAYWTISELIKKDVCEESQKDISAHIFTECIAIIGTKLEEILLWETEETYNTAKNHIKITRMEENTYIVKYKAIEIAKLYINSDNEGVKINLVRI